MRKIIWILILAGPLELAAQNVLSGAFEQYKGGNLNEARALIESAITDSSFMNNPDTWYLKGFIFKDLYKQDPGADSTLERRLESAMAFEHLIGMKGAEKYHQDAYVNLRYLATTFYNDAIRLLDPLKFELSKKAFDHFVYAIQLSKDTAISIPASEMDYYMTLASKHAALIKTDTARQDNHLESAIRAFQHILAMDSLHMKANYNLAVLYYNEAVNIISKLEYDQVDIFSFNEIEDRSIGFFKESLPYMHRAHRLDPTNQNTVEGLAGIYFGLRDFEKSNYYKDIRK